MKYKDKKHAKSAWVSKGTSQIVEKPWGYETTWAGFNGIHGKTLFISAGKRTSFKFHKMKSEVLFLRSGSAEVTFGDEHCFDDPVGHPLKVEIIYAGSSLLVQSSCPYRIHAIEDCEFVEIGNNSCDKPVRIEDDYGRVGADNEKS